MFKTSVVNTIYWCGSLLMWDHTDNFCGFPLIQKWTLTLSLITSIYSPPALAKSFWCWFGETEKFKAANCEIYHFGLNNALARGVVSSFSESLLSERNCPPLKKRQDIVSLLIQFHRIFFIFLLWSWCSNVMF